MEERGGQKNAKVEKCVVNENWEELGTSVLKGEEGQYKWMKGGEEEGAGNV